MALHVNLNLALESVDNGREAAAAAPVAQARAELAAQFIPGGARVLELGDGAELKRLLPHGCSHQRVNGAARGDFPGKAAARSDVIVMLGLLEQVADVDSIFEHLRLAARDVILSYAPRDLAVVADNERLSFFDLATLFDRHGFRIACTAPVDAREMLMRLTPADRLRPVAACSVAVVSENDTGSFGDRLGFHMINALLPGEADVHHLTFRTLHEARERYDLLVLGVGNSMFRPLIGDDVLGILARAKAAIGIFGTQYRELIPRPALERVLDRLDTWFAPYEDDVLAYGRGRDNVVHLGDWLIDQFPLARATLDEPLQIGAEIGSEIPLDRTIQIIQRHKQVYSARLHPLLCALTSAELAAYADEPASDVPGTASGKFRSMLIDIFGRTYPEKKFFMVDRDAVARYKARVHRNVATVAERIEALLRNVAVAH